MQKIILVYLLILLVSCRESKKEKKQAPIKTDISIPISDNFSNTYSVASDNLNEVFAGYFLQRNTIDLIDLKKKESLGQIQLQSSNSTVVTQGGGITFTEAGLFYKTHNQLFYFSEGSNEPELNYPLNSELPFGGETFFNSAQGIVSVLNDISPIPLLQDHLVLPIFSLDRPFGFAGVYLLSDRFEVRKVVPIDLDQDFIENLALYEGLQNPFISTNQKHIYIQFPFTSDVIKLDPESGKQEMLDVPGKFIHGRIDPSHFVKGEYQARSIRYSAQFWDIVWDPFREVFYRIEKEEHFDENGERINTRRGDHWINVISQDWEVLGHFKLPDDHLARPYVAEDGIYFQRSNSDNESELRFAFYSELPLK
ncbi:DUF4221 family protein [Algoriphagus yeomjeoni]|uniref:DUF4221 family protein n=1 Tax=Algoriphagus yeomjeoni TaxID=291403 RepID=UPI003CE4A583